MPPSVTGPLIQIRDLSHQFDGRLLFDNISLSVSPGDICLITGPSGVGKTTLLSLIGGIVSPQSGSITYGPELLPRERGFGYAMIDGPFFEMLSVQDNIYLLEHFAGVTLDLDYYHELIEYFEIASLVHMPVISLSTGQRERVNYVRALVHRPSVVILDEPGANLDAHLFAKLLSHLEQSSREGLVAYIIVSHDDRFLSIASEHTILTPR